MKIESQRLIIRSITTDDAEVLFSYRKNPLENKFQGWIPENLDEAKSFIESCPSTFNSDDTWYQMMLIEKSSNQIIGDMGIHFLSEENEVEIGCTLASSNQGKGYATESIETLIHVLHTEYSKNIFHGSVDPRNDASINLLKRLGFEKVKLVEKAFSLRGEWVDDLQYKLSL